MPPHLRQGRAHDDDGHDVDRHDDRHHNRDDDDRHNYGDDYRDDDRNDDHWDDNYNTAVVSQGHAVSPHGQQEEPAPDDLSQRERCCVAHAARRHERPMHDSIEYRQAQHELARQEVPQEPSAA